MAIGVPMTPERPAGAAGDLRPVLVTGAASGIGAAVLARLVADGHAVGALDRDGAALEATVDALGEGSRRVAAVAADVSDAARVHDAVAEVAGSLGGLGGLANVAGIGGYTGDVVATTTEAWEQTLAVNLTGVFLVSRAAIPWMRAGGGGRVVNVASQFGLVGAAGSPAYSAAKAGVIGLTRAMAVDHAADGILVNCVCPGPIDTPMLRASQQAGRLARSEAARTAGRSLLGGPGRPEDVAGAVGFLLGPDARHLTGVVLPVDGGWTAS